jgi:uncharacterized protein
VKPARIEAARATYLQATPDGCALSVRVHPGARRTAITGIHQSAIYGGAAGSASGPAGALKIALTTPPVDGRANQALVAFLADTLHLPKSAVTLVAGASSRSKLLRIAGRSAAQVQSALHPEG